MGSLMIPMSLEIEGTTLCHAESVFVKLARRAPLEVLQNRPVRQSIQMLQLVMGECQVNWYRQRSTQLLVLEEGLTRLLITSCVITAYTQPLDPALGMMSMTPTSVRVIIGARSVREKSMRNGSANGRVCLRENSVGWMNGRNGCAIISRICLICVKERNRT